MAIADRRKTVLQIVNEVQRKLGLTQTASVATNAQSIVLLDLLNDVVSEVANFGDWQETIATAQTTIASSVREYSVNTSAVVKNVRDIYYGDDNGRMWFVKVDQMRTLERNNSFGQPRQYTIQGTDSNGNPVIKVWPLPTSTEAGNTLSVLYYTVPPLYTTADDAVVVPFDSRLIVQGLKAEAILDEEGGSPTDHYTRERQKFDLMLKEIYNRFNSDTGVDLRFRPSVMRNRRR